MNPDDLRAIVVHSEMTRTGRFLCGNEKINQLYHNIVWGQKSNYLDIPTDCPQRDERLGWTGDTQVFCRTGAINYNVEKFFRKWMGDVALEQSPEGIVKGVVPAALKHGDTRTSAAWGDVACVVPWEIYLAYGNKADLKRNLPVMKNGSTSSTAQVLQSTCGSAECTTATGSQWTPARIPTSAQPRTI